MCALFCTVCVCTVPSNEVPLRLPPQDYAQDLATMAAALAKQRMQVLQHMLSEQGVALQTMDFSGRDVKDASAGLKI